MKQEPTDERLNALVDGELIPADAEELLERLRTDQSLRDRVSKLRLMKQLISHTYSETAVPQPITQSKRVPHLWALATAASLVCGSLLGWIAHQQTASVPLEKLAGESRYANVDNIVLHVASGSAHTGRMALDRAEQILESARASGRQVSVAIVANSAGLELMRRETSSHAQRIAALRTTYPSLSLIACGQTARRLRDSGAAVQLLDGIDESTSALDAIVQRMERGWTYVRI